MNSSGTSWFLNVALLQPLMLLIRRISYRRTVNWPTKKAPILPTLQMRYGVDAPANRGVVTGIELLLLSCYVKMPVRGCSVVQGCGELLVQYYRNTRSIINTPSGCSRCFASWVQRSNQHCSALHLNTSISSRLAINASAFYYCILFPLTTFSACLHLKLSSLSILNTL